MKSEGSPKSPLEKLLFSTLDKASIPQQLHEGKQVIARRTGARKYLAYFQAYSNTWDTLERLRAMYDQALADPDVIGISVGTRPDCLGHGVLELLRSRLFQTIQKMPPSFFDRRSTGDLMSLVTSDLDRVRDVVGPAILHLFRTSVTVIWSLATLFYLDAHLALWALAPLVLAPFLANRGMAALHRSYGRLQASLSELNTFAHDALAGVAVIKGFGRERLFQERFGKHSEALRSLAVRSSWIQGSLWPAITALGGLGVCLLLWKGCESATLGRTSVGTVAAAVMVFFRLQWPMIGLGWVTNLFQRGVASLDRLDALEKEMEACLSELPTQLLQLFALVPQDGFLFSQTIAENILMGRPEGAPESDAGTWAAHACFDQDIPQIPGGYQALLGQRGINLSGGQRQRLSLARALSKEAPMLLLSGQARVVTSHRYSAFRLVDRTMCRTVGGGKVLEAGSHEELIAAGGYYAESWRLQALEREIEEA